MWNSAYRKMLRNVSRSCYFILALKISQSFWNYRENEDWDEFQRWMFFHRLSEKF